MAVDTLYNEFQEAVNLPDQRRRQAQAQAQELRQKTAAAKKCFEVAEIEGQESASLFEVWQEFAGKLKLAEARAEALHQAAPGKQAAEVAARLIKGCHTEVESLQVSKNEQEDTIGELQEKYMEALKSYLACQERQRELADMVKEAKEHAPGEAAIKLGHHFKDLREFEIGEQVLYGMFGANNRAAFSLSRQKWNETGA